jgi:hypothetical protein
MSKYKAYFFNLSNVASRVCTSLLGGISVPRELSLQRGIYIGVEFVFLPEQYRRLSTKLTFNISA